MDDKLKGRHSSIYVAGSGNGYACREIGLQELPGI